MFAADLDFLQPFNNPVLIGMLWDAKAINHLQRVDFEIRYLAGIWLAVSAVALGFLLRQNFKSAAMLRTDQLEVATIKCENACDVQTFCYRDDQRVYKIEFGIGILPENFCGTRVIFLTRNLES